VQVATAAVGQADHLLALVGGLRLRTDARLMPYLAAGLRQRAGGSP